MCDTNPSTIKIIKHKKEALPYITKYFSLIDASFGYHNLMLDKISSYLPTFTDPFGRNRYRKLFFRDMFQEK